MGIFRFPWKISSDTPEPMIGILAFEVAGLMSKLVNLWHSLSDKEFQWLREQISDSVGVKRFVSEDEDHLMELVLEEIVESFGSLSSSVARLGKRCRDPSYHDGLDDGGDRSDPRSDLRCPYSRKKMEKKVRKMERFVAAAAQLSHEQDVLVELEQTLRRMMVNAAVDRLKVLEFQQKVTWQRQEVKSLRAASPWVRSHGYSVRIMARSLFTILERIKIVFGSTDNRRESFNERRNSDFLPRASSFSPAVHPYETQRQWQMYSFLPASAHARRLRRHGGSFSGCVERESQHSSAHNAMGGSMRLVTKAEECPNHDKVYEKLAMFKSTRRSLNATPGTLGHAALALHYANVVRVVERLATSPHLVGPDARDDLYAMLPGSIKSALRAKLRTVGSRPSKGSSCTYDPALAAQWNSALLRILGWLAPLAHNTLRWHSERNIESQNEFSRTNLFLVLTLYHADQAKTEAAIIELLLGLNYICRISALDDAAVVRDQATSS